MQGGFLKRIVGGVILLVMLPYSSAFSDLESLIKSPSGMSRWDSGKNYKSSSNATDREAQTKRALDEKKESEDNKNGGNSMTQQDVTAAQSLFKDATYENFAPQEDVVIFDPSYFGGSR